MSDVGDGDELVLPVRSVKGNWAGCSQSCGKARTDAVRLSG